MPSDPSGGASKTAQLSDVSMPRLLFALLRNRFTGTLRLAQPDPAGERLIYLRGGMPVFTDWVSMDDVLGQVLVAEGALPADSLHEALASLSNDGGLLGEILVKNGQLDEKSRTACLRKQCLRKLSHTFALRTGEVAIVAEDHERGVGDGLGQVNVLELVRRGVARHYDVARVRAEMGPQYSAAHATTTAFDRYRAHFQFRPDDEALLAALATGTSIQELSGLPGLSEARAAPLMFTLWACQMLHPAQAGAAAPPKAAAAKPAPPKTSAPPSPRPKSPPLPPTAKPEPKPKPAPEPKSAPKPAAPKAAVSADEEFLEELQRLEALIAEDSNAFTLFGIEPDATKKDVRAAWADLSKKFHPDALQSRGLGELRDRVEGVFGSLSEANLTLGDKDKREELRKLIEAGGKGRRDATAMARGIIESEMHAKAADKLLKAGRYPQALELYEQAVSINPEEPDLQAAHMWCRFQVEGGDAAVMGAIVARLDEISKEYPAVARAHYFRGLLLLKMGNDQLAVGAFEQAHKADRRLIDAERQARAIKRRLHPPGEKGDKAGGLFGRFFKK